MGMNEKWNSVTIEEICFAMRVIPHTGGRTHKKRPYQGFVLNDAESVRIYYFDDGRVLRTEGNSLFYLPKGTSYRVDALRDGICYAINFQARIEDDPFCVTLRNVDPLLRNFKAAADAWQSNDSAKHAVAMRAVYDAICRGQKEQQRSYVPGTQVSLISPALEKIDQSFNDPGLSVSELALLCGISEVYLRRLFLGAVGASPKEYIIQKRIEYAKSLLRAGGFSVTEVATLCGYSEPCHFSREFSKRIGVSPRDY